MRVHMRSPRLHPLDPECRSPVSCLTGHTGSVDLELRPIRPGDGPVLHGLVAHPEVWEWLTPAGSRGPAAIAQCAAWARRDAAHWELHGFGKWLVLEDGTPVGRGGLNVTFVDGRPEVEVGWAVARENWGRGIATEIARASLDEAGKRERRRGYTELAHPQHGVDAMRDDFDGARPIPGVVDVGSVGRTAS